MIILENETKEYKQCHKYGLYSNNKKKSHLEQDE